MFYAITRNVDNKVVAIASDSNIVILTGQIQSQFGTPKESEIFVIPGTPGIYPTDTHYAQPIEEIPFRYRMAIPGGKN
jgi:hypothetical protein